MICFRAVRDHDPCVDGCGNETVAVLELNGTSVALCKGCTLELLDTMLKFSNTTHCYECAHFKTNDALGTYCNLHVHRAELLDTCDEVVRKD